MRKIADVKEREIERQLCQRVAEQGGLCLKVTVLGRRGFPDRLVVLPGRIVFCELKRPRRGRVAVHQILYIEKLRALGAVACVVRTSSDIDALLG
jgi:Holliday junction resolvase